MNKHLIGYSLLIVVIAILAGQVTSPKNNDINLEEPKTVILEPKDYKAVKRELKNLKTELEQKENYISKLNDRINEKNSEIAKVKSAKIETVEPKEEMKKNHLLNLLSSASKMTDNPQIKKMMERQMLKRYGSLFDKLNLSDEKKDKLVELLMQRGKQKQEKLMNLLSENKGQQQIKAEDFKALTEKSDADMEIEELLGDDYEDFEFHEKTAMERRQLSDISNSLGEADKLSSDQEDKVVRLLKQRNDDIKAGNKKSDEEYITESSEFLNDTQSEELSKSLKRNKNDFGALPFINPGGGTVHIIEQ